MESRLSAEQRSETIKQLEQLRAEIDDLRTRIESADAEERRHDSQPFFGPDRRKAA